MNDKLGEDGWKYDLQNAANDPANCSTIANSFVSKNVDLIMANATPAVQAAATATGDIPILGQKTGMFPWQMLSITDLLEAAVLSVGSRSTAWPSTLKTSPAPWAPTSPAPPTWPPWTSRRR